MVAGIAAKKASENPTKTIITLGAIGLVGYVGLKALASKIPSLGEVKETITTIGEGVIGVGETVYDDGIEAAKTLASGFQWTLDSDEKVAEINEAITNLGLSSTDEHFGLATVQAENPGIPVVNAFETVDQNLAAQIEEEGLTQKGTAYDPETAIENNYLNVGFAPPSEWNINIDFDKIREQLNLSS
jgi:hypothetical protein